MPALSFQIVICEPVGIHIWCLKSLEGDEEQECFIMRMVKHRSKLLRDCGISIIRDGELPQIRL